MAVRASAAANSRSYRDCAATRRNALSRCRFGAGERRGSADSVAAVVLGEFLDCEESDGDYCALDVLEERLLRWEVPVLAGFPAGHGVRCRALPLGVTVRVEEGRLDVLQAPWAQ